MFSNAALGFVEFRVACEVLRSFEETDVFIRGLDHRFRRDIERIGCESTRDLLRVRFSRLPETLRALYEYSVIDCRETEPAMSLSSTGQREESTICRLHVRSCYAALAIAEMVRREFAARPEQEAPQVLIVAHEPRPHAESTPHPPTSIDAPARTRAPSAEPPPSRPDSPGAHSREGVAGTTPPDSGTASSSSSRPPMAPPRIFGLDSSLPPLSFVSPKTAAEAAAAAEALAASNIERRNEEIAQGLYSPRRFAPPLLTGAPPLTRPPLTGAPLPAQPPPAQLPLTRPSLSGAPPSAPPPPTGAPPLAPPPPIGVPPTTPPLPSGAPTPGPPPPIESTPLAPPPQSGATQPPAQPQAAPSASAPSEPTTVSKSGRRAHKRHPTSPLELGEPKRSTATGSSAENPVVVESPEKLVEGPRNRFGAFEFDETRSPRDSPVPLVIAESEPNIGASSMETTEQVSRRSSPRPRPTEEPVPESPRSPSPSPPEAIPSPREAASASTPRTTSTPMWTPVQFPEYAADDAAAHAPYTSPMFERRGDSTSSSPAPQPSRMRTELSDTASATATWYPSEPSPVRPKPPPRALDPTKDAVAVVVATNSYTLTESGRKIELVRRVLVHRADKTLYDRRVEIRAPTLLNTLEVDRSNYEDFTAPISPYSEVIRELSQHLPYHYCVFHDRSKTLAALRLALPNERCFDLGLHVHLRNDALRRGGKNVTRSRHRVVPLEDLWLPILGQVMPRGLRQLADGMLRMFATVSRSMGMTSPTPSMNTTPQFEWLSRGDVVHELASSLLIEQRAIESTSEAHRVSAPENDELVPPKKGSAPFRFELQRLPCIDLRRFETINRLFIHAPHFGLAFLQSLVDANIVPADYQTELANRQRQRIATHDTTLAVFPININAPDAETFAAAAAAIEDFLMFDDSKIGALAERPAFPEFETVEVVRRA